MNLAKGRCKMHELCYCASVRVRSLSAVYVLRTLPLTVRTYVCNLAAQRMTIIDFLLTRRERDAFLHQLIFVYPNQ